MLVRVARVVSNGSQSLLSPQLLQQRLRLLQIARVEPLREPPVHRSKQFARLLHLALVTPEACEAHGGAEYPGFCKRTRSLALRAGDDQRRAQVKLSNGLGGPSSPSRDPQWALGPGPNPSHAGAMANAIASIVATIVVRP
jgi:hypothetical protein